MHFTRFKISLTAYNCIHFDLLNIFIIILYFPQLRTTHNLCSSLRIINVPYFLFTELGCGDDLGDRGFHGHNCRPGDRRQRSAGRALGLLRWYERNGFGASTIRLYRRNGATFCTQATTVTQVTASYR